MGGNPLYWDEYVVVLVDKEMLVKGSNKVGEKLIGWLPRAAEWNSLDNANVVVVKYFFNDFLI